MSGNLGTHSGIEKKRLIKSAINGLRMPPDKMEQLLANAPDAIRKDIEREMDEINTWHPAVLYWMEHGVWEEIVAYYAEHRTDASSEAARAA